MLFIRDEKKKKQEQENIDMRSALATHISSFFFLFPNVEKAK